MAERRLRILHVIQTRVFGGGELQVLSMVQEVAERGHSVAVICHVENKVFLSKLLAAGIEVYPVRPVRAPGAPKAIALAIALAVLLMKLRRKFKPNIICANTLLSAVVLSCIKQLIKCTIVYAVMVVHDTKRLSPIFKLISRQIDGVIYNSKYTRGRYQKFFKNTRSSLVNYSLVPPIKLNADSIEKVLSLRRKYVGTGEALVGFVGRIAPEKRAEDFVDAAMLITQKNQKIKFIFLGGEDARNPKYCSAIRYSAEKMIGKSKIFFCRHVDDVCIHLAALDAIVIPTLGEGFGRVALEAAYLNVPVIATTPSGTDEILAHTHRAAKVPWLRPDLIANEVLGMIEEFPFSSTGRITENHALSTIFRPERLIENEIDFYHQNASP